jgi:hypothetical protein
MRVTSAPAEPKRHLQRQGAQAPGLWSTDAHDHSPFAVDEEYGAIAEHLVAVEANGAIGALSGCQLGTPPSEFRFAHKESFHGVMMLEMMQLGGEVCIRLTADDPVQSQDAFLAAPPKKLLSAFIEYARIY